MLNMKKITKISWLASALICATALLACGGGGGGGGTASTPSAPDVTLKGTAAAGAPMAHASIKLIDKNGQTLTTTADAGGAYQFNDISGMVRPLLLVAQGNLGGIDTTFMSLLLSNGGNIANITPLTDAIVSQGTDGRSPTALVQLFSLQPNNINIDENKVTRSANAIASSIANVLEALRAGSSTNYSPLGTSFVADGSDPFDKVHDLLATYLIPGLGGGIDITLVDKSGTNGGAIVASSISTRQTTSVSALPAQITALKFDKVKDFFDTFNTYTSSASTLTNPNGSFAALIHDSYADYGQTKAQLLAISPSPFLNATLSNPVIQSCKADGTCLVTFKQGISGQQTFSKGEFNLKWDNTAQKWTSIGHGSDDLMVDFDTYAQLNLSDPSHPIYTVLSFNIRNKANTLPFYTAEASFVAPNNTTDLTLNFASSPTCESGLTNATLTNGLPLQGATNCESWQFYTTTSDINALKQINQKILAGGYTLKVRAYLKTNHASYVEMVKPLTQPFVTNDQVNESSFPQITVRAGSGSTLPSIEISNYSDFSNAGYTCLSTSQSSCAALDCDPITLTCSSAKLTELTENYTLLTSKNISPKSADGWASSDTINSLVLTVRDRNNRKLRVVQ
jgi:hypothetical protein